MYSLSWIFNKELRFFLDFLDQKNNIKNSLEFVKKFVKECGEQLIMIEFANFWLPSLPFLDILNWGKTFKNQWFRENSLINSLTVFLTPNDHPHWNAYCKQNHASNHFPFASRCVHFSKSLTVRCSVQYFLFMRGDFLPIPQFFYTDLCNFCVILLK